jgi:transcriptional regulator GlxA family with amidase domain
MRKLPPVNFAGPVWQLGQFSSFLRSCTLPLMQAVHPVRQRRDEGNCPRQVAVERAEAYVRAHPDAPASLHTLCRIVGLSERGLRNAFYSVRGMGPKRWILAERLQAVRNALSDQGGGPTTVTNTAADYGFYELGRFAGIYRAAFGEAPSETLRSTIQKTGVTPRRKRTRQCLRQHVR